MKLFLDCYLGCCRGTRKWRRIFLVGQQASNETFFIIRNVCRQMKLQECDNCGKFIPRRLRICPYCDSILKKNTSENVSHIALVLFWGFNAVMAIWHIVYWIATSSILKGKINSSGAGHAISSAFTGSGEIIIYWLVGCFILGIFLLWSR